LFRPVVHPVFKSDSLEDLLGFGQLLPCRQMGLAQFESHSDVLRSCERFEKVMSLKDKSNLSPKLFHGSGAGSDEGLAQDFEFSLLDAAKGPKKR
jgi:hypothetical protein